MQRSLAAVFLALGGWCLIAPGWVLSLMVRPEYLTGGAIAPLLMACFGAQACLVGLLALTAQFKAVTFAWFGAALIPFFWFDWYFVVHRPLLTPLALLDLAGNTAMLAMCATGWRALRGAAR